MPAEWSSRGRCRAFSQELFLTGWSIVRYYLHCIAWRYSPSVHCVCKYPQGHSPRWFRSHSLTVKNTHTENSTLPVFQVPCFEICRSPLPTALYAFSIFTNGALWQQRSHQTGHSPWDMLFLSILKLMKPRMEDIVTCPLGSVEEQIFSDSLSCSAIFP